MHIPDGWLDPKMSGGLLGLAAAVAAYCAVKVIQAITAVVPGQVLAGIGSRLGNIRLAGRRVLTQIGEDQLGRMGTVAAWIFAAQMFNFPVASGTSGHLLGGVFAGVVLGPFAGTVVISAVLLVQALFFADGGLLALGANIVNMGLVGTFASYYFYAWLKRSLPETAGIAIAAWASVMLASLGCSLELGCSGTIGFWEVTRAMAKVHSLIGIAEAVLTLVLVRCYRWRDTQ